MGGSERGQSYPLTNKRSSIVRPHTAAYNMEKNTERLKEISNRRYEIYLSRTFGRPSGIGGAAIEAHNQRLQALRREDAALAREEQRLKQQWDS